MSMSLNVLDGAPTGEIPSDKAGYFSTFFLVSNIINVINEVTGEPEYLSL